MYSSFYITSFYVTPRTAGMAEVDWTMVSYILESSFLSFTTRLGHRCVRLEPTLRLFVIVYQIFDPTTPNLNNGLGVADSVLLMQLRCYFVA